MCISILNQGDHFGQVGGCTYVQVPPYIHTYIYGSNIITTDCLCPIQRSLLSVHSSDSDELLFGEYSKMAQNYQDSSMHTSAFFMLYCALQVEQQCKQSLGVSIHQTSQYIHPQT